MSDQWEFYPSQMGEHTAFIFVNASIGARLAASGRTGQVLARVTLKHPREDGLTTTEEFQALSDLDDAFVHYCSTAGADMVGRVTVAGFRDFAVYADDAAKVAHGLETIARDEHGYEIELMTRDDPEFEVYWKHLYPTPLDWQLITNAKLLDALDEAGDACEVPRRIDHFVYFADAAHRAQFATRIAGEGFAIEAELPPDAENPGFGLHFHREGVPDIGSINEVTFALFRLAEEFEGEYAGWETGVIQTD